MTDNQDIYTLFNFVNNNPFWLTILNSIISLSVGGWIVYQFNLKIEKKKSKEQAKLNYENVINLLIGTIEELKIVGLYISEYHSKGEYQIALKEAKGYFNEALYHIRLSNLDLFRIKFAEISSRFIKELSELKKYTIIDENLNRIEDLVKKSSTPNIVPFDKENIINEDGSVYSEGEVLEIIIQFLLQDGNFLNVISEIKTKLQLLQYRL
jgi:hypothetical protein